MNEMVKIQHQQWARDLDDQRRSGLTQREWCRIHGISIHTFEYRCRIVRQTMENLLSEKQPSVQFAELDVQPSVPETSGIRIQASGISVEFFPDADCNQNQNRDGGTLPCCKVVVLRESTLPVDTRI